MFVDVSAPIEAAVIDSVSRTIRPATPDGDTYFGLAVGTNGTAAMTRRALAEPANSGPYTWVRYSGRPAVGATLIPTGRDTWSNPWDGPGVDE